MNNEKDNTGQNGPEKTKPEIMYVPLDVRTIENEDDAINIIEVLKTFWDGRKTIYKTVAVFTVIGLVVALLSVEEYTSIVRVLPETEPNESELSSRVPRVLDSNTGFSGSRYDRR